jgi:hypothetical protein
VGWVERGETVVMEAAGGEMSAVLALLNTAPRHPDPTWWALVERSLAERPSEWVSAVRSPGFLADGRAWTLLAWAELTATEVVRRCSRPLLESAAFAICLAGASDLDPRDVAVVGSLLRRAAVLADLDFAESIAAGCARAGEFGATALPDLLGVHPAVPPTHVEQGSGASFSFHRLPADLDVDALERWLERDG